MMKYDSYKDSGIDWLSNVPSHWNTYRLDWTGFLIRGNTGFKKDELQDKGEYIALQYGKTYQVDEINDAFQFFVNGKFFKKDQIVNQGDVIFISTSETIEDLGHSCFYNRNDLGLIGGEQILFKPNRKLVCGKFLYYYSKNFSAELRKYATGLKVYRFSIDDLKQIFIAIPSLDEQTAIAEYLDTKTQAIDQRVSLLEKKIGYYQELRKSLINETVTKGLDKNVKLKDSGIDWIGQIPEHWEVKRIKDIFSTLAGGTPSTQNQEYWIGNIPWIPSGKVQNNDVLIESVEEYISDLALRESSTKIAKKNSVLIALTGATCSNIGYLTFDTTINQSIVALYPQKRNQTLSRFYFYFLMSAKEKIRTYMTGGAQGGINQEDVRFLDIVYPSKEEQEEIVKFLDAKLDTIAKIITNIQTQITTLKELRKTLINDVVTGKIKVSHE